MSFCCLNGLSCSIAHEQSSHAREHIGASERAYDGELRSTSRALKRTWRMKTVPLSISDAECIEGMILGLGWHFDFESDLYSQLKGLGPNTGYAGTTISSAQYKIGSCSCKVTSGSTGPTYDVNLTASTTDGTTGDFSVIFWQYVAAWAHYGIVYDADTATYTEYIAGAASSSIDNTFRDAMVASGDVVLMGKKATDNASSDVYYDDLVILPFKATAGLVSALYNGGTGLEYADTPRVRLSGDVIKSSTTYVTCQGKLTNVPHTQATLSGSWSDQVRSVEFDLEEV